MLFGLFFNLLFSVWLVDLKFAETKRLDKDLIHSLKYHVVLLIDRIVPEGVCN